MLVSEHFQPTGSEKWICIQASVWREGDWKAQRKQWAARSSGTADGFALVPAPLHGEVYSVLHHLATNCVLLVKHQFVQINLSCRNYPRQPALACQLGELALHQEQSPELEGGLKPGKRMKYMKGRQGNILLTCLSSYFLHCMVVMATHGRNLGISNLMDFLSLITIQILPFYFFFNFHEWAIQPKKFRSKHFKYLIKIILKYFLLSFPLNAKTLNYS